MMRGSLSRLLCVIVVLSLGGVARAQEAQPKAAAPPVEVKPLQVTVKEVSGAAQYLQAGKDRKWRPLKPGQKLDELAVIRTGFRTRVVLVFADNSEVVIKRATKMGVAQFRKVGKVTRTRVGLKYGSMHIRVSKARGPSDFTVATSVATLAVRGSISTAGFSDFGLLMAADEGDWTVTVGSRLRKVGPGETTDGDLTRSVETAKRKRAVQLGDVYGGLSKIESHSLIEAGGGRGIIGGAGAGEGATRITRLSSKISREEVPTPSPELDGEVGM